MYKGLLSIISFLSLLPLSAQDLIYTKQIINTLCDQKFHGRGYINNGSNKAGNFLIEELKRIGLSPIVNNDFKQIYSFSVNTFPKRVKLAVNGKALEVGRQFIVDASSAKWNQNIPLTYDSVSKCFVNSQYPCTLKVVPKLTFSVSKVQNKSTVFMVLKDSSMKWQKAPYILLNASLDAKLEKDYEVFNIVSQIQGQQFPDSFIVFSAHYDHLGRLGKSIYFPGANDNASGVSMLLNLAKALKQQNNKYTIVFILFSGEEIGLEGSSYFVNHPLIDLKKIKFLINLDLNGTGDYGATVVNASIFPKQFEILKSINAQQQLLPQLKSRGKAANSDHYWFSEKGVPSFFIYTMGGISAYHDIDDRPETLPLTKYKALYQLLMQFANQI
jgi:aminopeptidase YwaD